MEVTRKEAAEAKQAKKRLKYNMKLIQKYPEKVNDGFVEKTEWYRNFIMSKANEAIEKQNAQRSGWTCKKRTETYAVSIVLSATRKSKGGGAR